MTISVHSHSGSTAANTDLDLSNTAYYNSITLVNRSTVASPVELWAKFDGTASAVAADDNYLIPPASTRTFRNHTVPNEPATGVVGITPVHIISSTICAFSVEFS